MTAEEVRGVLEEQVHSGDSRFTILDSRQVPERLAREGKARVNRIPAAFVAGLRGAAVAPA